MEKIKFTAQGCVFYAFYDLHSQVFYGERKRTQLKFPSANRGSLAHGAGKFRVMRVNAYKARQWSEGVTPVYPLKPHDNPEMVLSLPHLTDEQTDAEKQGIDR